jgi:hypothetical protein
MGIALGFSLAGCGGDSDNNGAACSNAAGCGGDVVGTWTIQSTCVTPSMPSMGCEGTTADTSGFKTTGSITFNADKTFTSNITFSGSVTTTLPASCLMRNGVTATCAQVQETLQPSVTSGDYTSATCTATGNGGCACTLGLVPQTDTNSGSYSTSGSVLTEIDPDGSTDDNAYCVKGNTMTLSPTSSSGSSGSIVLTKG